MLLKLAFGFVLQELQVACTIKMKSIASFFKPPAAASDNKIVTEPIECAPSTKSDTVANEHHQANEEKCHKENQNSDDGKLERHRVNGLVVNCKGDSNRRPSNSVKETKPEIQKAGLVIKQNTSDLNSSLDEFQTPRKPTTLRKTKKRSQKPGSRQKRDVLCSDDGKSTKKAKLSDMTDKSVSKEENDPVLEISYEDFLRENTLTEKTDETASEDNTKQTKTEETASEDNTKQTKTEETASEDNTKQTKTEETASEDNTKQTKTEEKTENIKCFAERKSEGDNVSHKTKKLRTRQCKTANETPKTSTCDLTDDEKPKPPAVNIMNFFSASHKSDANRKSTDQLVVLTTAEVHSPPMPSEHKVFNIFSPKQRNSGGDHTTKDNKQENNSCPSPVATTTAKKRSSNVIVESAEVDLTITEIEPPLVQEHCGKSSPKVKNSSSKQERGKVALAKGNNTGKKVTEDARASKQKGKESECTIKSNVNPAKETLHKDSVILENTTHEDITENVTKSDDKHGMTTDSAIIESKDLEKRKTSIAVKIASLQSIALPTGRSQTQMTLNYSHRKDEGSVLQKPLKSRKNKNVTRRRRRLDSEGTPDETSEDDIITTDVMTDRRKTHHQRKVPKSRRDNEHVAVGTTLKKGTISEDVYESVFVETGCRLRKTPIKLKITRYVISGF